MAAGGVATYPRDTFHARTSPRGWIPLVQGHGFTGRDGRRAAVAPGGRPLGVADDDEDGEA
ncbi:hypothetical protein QQM39_17970 [Streptomyces sp. DT2A-34]|uniref:hypothetical protein n=1 Tax=Streptomyces sp. DT2A-34 TaxID=3051182 RepID=UPI00265B9EC4|nr:hypothetical protein [Streptomyces sp. DT2A-34]MDO0912663.1 hypothetical protein [Streptomyces sp. DT2A-34]